MLGDTGCGTFVVCWELSVSYAARNGFVGASRGLRPGALDGEGRPGDKVAGDAVRGLRKGLLDWLLVAESGSVSPGEGRRTAIK